MEDQQKEAISRYCIAGVDLAWKSQTNGSGIAVGNVTGNQLTLEQLHCDIVGLQSVRQILENTGDLHGVAIDAPLIIANSTGARTCEQALDTVYRPRWAGCYPSNLSLYPDASSVALAHWLEGWGLEHLGSAQSTKWQIECYPHPAIIELFGLARRLKYKKGSLNERQSGQIALARHIRTLEDSNELKLSIPGEFELFLDDGHILSLKGNRLKANEDALDSIICLYVAGLYATGQEMTIFGDNTTGYIVVPKQKR